MITNEDGDAVDIDGSLWDSPEPEQHSAYTFSKDQQAAYDWLIPFCRGLTPFRKVLLKGFAGTGKSFLLNRVIEAVLTGKRIGMTAPTHKAVRVLKKFSEFPDKLTFGTIHSFLGLKEHIDTKTGKRSFKPDFDSGRERKIDYTDILIVDESSMLPDELFDHIEDEQRSNSRLLVIYAGDELQIPPVRDEEDRKKMSENADAIPFIPVRQRAHKIHVLSLTTPQRQSAQSPIIRYAHNIRNNIDNPRIPFDFLPEEEEVLTTVPRNRFALENRLQLFLTKEFQQDPDFVKVIAWRNDTVNYFNKWIRNMLHGQPMEADLPFILPDDLLVMDEPVIRDGNVVLHNNQEVKVKSTKLENRVLRYTTTSFTGPQSNEFTHSVWKTIVEDENGMIHTIEILDPAYVKPYELMRKEIANAANQSFDREEKSRLWKLFYAIPKRFGWVKYNYALTIHKAQGSTYTNTISMEWDIDVNRNVEEGNRIRYVAATRSSHRLFIVK